MWPWAVPPTPCCISSPWRSPPTWTSHWMTSNASPTPCRASARRRRPANGRFPTCTAPAASSASLTVPASCTATCIPLITSRWKTSLTTGTSCATPAPRKPSRCIWPLRATSSPLNRGRTPRCSIRSIVTVSTAPSTISTIRRSPKAVWPYCAATSRLTAAW